MAEIRVEPRRRGWTTALMVTLGLVIVLALAYYFVYYRNG